MDTIEQVGRETERDVDGDAGAWLQPGDVGARDQGGRLAGEAVQPRNAERRLRRQPKDHHRRRIVAQSQSTRVVHDQLQLFTRTDLVFTVQCKYK